jgi:alpha-galactosidase/6-phospho-beta-glucosidase family protein
MRERVVLIGAGSVAFTRGLVADLVRQGEPMDLSLVDVDPGELEVAEGLTGKMIQAQRAPVSLRASTDRRDVLAGATAVICTIGVGGRRAWERDVFIPRKYGIYQPVGDSVMRGGSSRALRMIPAMVAVAEGGGLRPIVQPPLPAGIVGTLATRLAWVETVVEAALEGSRAKFIQALLLDGAVSSVEMAARLADELLAAQSEFLPQFKNRGG